MITVFGYDFPHRKTCEGLIQLKLLNIDFTVVLAPWRDLNVRDPPVRIGPRSVSNWEPSDICKLLDIPYWTKPHDSIDGEHECGIILGARIIPNKVIELFRRGIINLHPGLLPYYKGLYCEYHEYNKRGTQTITAHWIDEKVDEGEIIATWNIKLYNDDSWLDRWDRGLNMQIHTVLPELLEMIE